MSAALAPVRSELRGFAGYRSARVEAAGGRTFLNANESPWAPRGDRSGVHRYPEPQPGALRAALAVPIAGGGDRRGKSPPPATRTARPWTGDAP